MSPAKVPACQTTLSTSLMPGIFIKQRFSMSIHSISILDETTDLQLLEKLGSECKNNLCAMSAWKALFVKIQLCLFKRHFWWIKCHCRDFPAVWGSQTPSCSSSSSPISMMYHRSELNFKSDEACFAIRGSVVLVFTTRKFILSSVYLKFTDYSLLASSNLQVNCGRVKCLISEQNRTSACMRIEHQQKYKDPDSALI